MNLTEEQAEVVDYIKNLEGKDLILIDSVAGSGKTATLRVIADTIGKKKGIYLAYNKAIASESSKKFPSNIDCRTTHSLAYRATVSSMGLKVGFFGYRQISEKISYSAKCQLADDIKEFCLSKYLTYKEYAEVNGIVNVKLANKYLTKMSDGSIECTHDFYLKLFHMLLASDDVDMKEYELAMLDEAGDLNEVTLEIFKLLPARIKVAVGDPHQNIYMFNHTINCFESLEGQGTTFKLSKSFRVPQHIASRVEHFCQTNLDSDMKFEGVESDNTTIATRGYISRTNSGLIGKIIELGKLKMPYGLVRPAKEIFKVPLMIAMLKYQGKIYDPAFKHVQEGVDEWYENVDGCKAKNPTMFGYLVSKYKEDIAVTQAISTIMKYGKSVLFTAYDEAKSHESKCHDFTLLTAHSSKGLEFDEVILASDMDFYVTRALDRIADNNGREYIAYASDKETLNLYYVACTRALVKLTNATHL